MGTLFQNFAMVFVKYDQSLASSPTPGDYAQYMGLWNGDGGGIVWGVARHGPEGGCALGYRDLAGGFPISDFVLVRII